MTKSIDPDQTVPSGADWSGSALFAYSSLSEILEHLQYYVIITIRHVLIRRKWKIFSDILMSYLTAISREKKKEKRKKQRMMWKTLRSKLIMEKAKQMKLTN